MDQAISATQATLNDLTAQEGDLSAALTGLNEKLSAIRVGRNQLNLAPVSYTHLDVYKRQSTWSGISGREPSAKQGPRRSWMTLS